MSGASEGEWRPKVSLAFRAVGGAAAYLDGKPTARIYVEKRDLKAQVEEYIAEGRLTLGEAERPRLLEVDGGGGFYVALLGDGAETKPTAVRRSSMHPVTVYDEERLILRLLKENRPHEFTELLRSYMKIDRRRRRPTWRDFKPYSSSSTNEGRGPMRADDGRRDRTVLLLNGRPAMGEPWSLWESYQKSQVAGFLAEALRSMYVNSSLIRYGESGSPAPPRGQEADIRRALKTAALANPERLVVITDKLDHEAAGLLDTLGHSGVRTLVINLGDEEQPCTGEPASVQVLRLRAGGDMANMMHGLAAWV
ncbi:MAG: hypothetical protein ABIJ47_09965 [Candidatus Bathyarchaeota archaeon]